MYSRLHQFGEVAWIIIKEMLDKFAKQCPPEDCNVEILDYWLRKHVKHIDQHQSHSIWWF